MTEIENRATETIHLTSWFQGPTGFGQGGWTAHRFVTAIGKPVTVAIRAPIPLKTDLRIESIEADKRWILAAPDGSTVLEATRWEPDYPETEPVTIEHARDARDRFPRPGDLHPVPVCFSCGLDPSSMQVQAGLLGDGRFATDWTVPDWAASDDDVDEGALWAAIDCAAAWYAGCEGGIRHSVTAQLAVEVRHRLKPGETYALVSWAGDWPLGTWDGRKRGAASAAFDRDGRCVAVSRSFWIALE